MTASATPPAAAEAAERYRVMIKAAGFDEQRLCAAGEATQADPTLPHLLKQDLLGDVEARLN